jgi:nuclear transport factor 2 (NTF2) superfamily protein
MNGGRRPIPPFTAQTAALKVRLAENLWNSRDPERIAGAYTLDSCWRNRTELIQGRESIIAFLSRKWSNERQYRLIKELWAYSENKIAVRLAYEWHDESGHWFRSYGNENWAFDDYGLMSLRYACINDAPIKKFDRLLIWDSGPERPESHPGMTEMGL